jgi:hypothetical protein
LTYDLPEYISNELKDMREKAKKSKSWLGIATLCPALMIMTYVVTVADPLRPKINPHDYCSDPELTIL